MSWHDELPWNRIRNWYRALRGSLFRRPRPEGIYLRVEHERPVEYIERIFGVRSFAPNWETSYYKKGEDLNLARVVHAPEGRITWWQDHLRGWAGPDGSYVDLGGHWEPEPTEHPHAHLAGTGFSRAKGLKHFRDVLDEVGVEYEEVEYRR